VSATLTCTPSTATGPSQPSYHSLVVTKVQVSSLPEARASQTKMPKSARLSVWSGWTTPAFPAHSANKQTSRSALRLSSPVTPSMDLSSNTPLPVRSTLHTSQRVYRSMRSLLSSALVSLCTRVWKSRVPDQARPSPLLVPVVVLDHWLNNMQRPWVSTPLLSTLVMRRRLCPRRWVAMWVKCSLVIGRILTKNAGIHRLRQV